MIKIIIITLVLIYLYRLNPKIDFDTKSRWWILWYGADSSARNYVRILKMK